MQNRIEQTLDSREVAEMIGKEHKNLVRDIRRYISQFGELKIEPSDFFRESTYQTEQNKELPCYRITKKGCEFIAHKLTGTKGTAFTARYINRFHEMKNIIADQTTDQEPEIPWFIRKVNGRYIVLERDFISITGVDIREHKAFYREEYFLGGCDFNGFGTKESYKPGEFKEKYGFDYGDEDYLMYLYLSGVKIALMILANDRKIQMKQGAYEMISDGINAVRPIKKAEIATKKPEKVVVKGKGQNGLPVQINIVVGTQTSTV